MRPRPGFRYRRWPRGRIAVPVLALALGLAVAGGLGLTVRPAWAQQTPYRVELRGVADDELRALLTATSNLVRLQDEPPPSPVGLRRRAEADRERLQTALRSLGYYAGTVDIALDTEVSPARVTVTVDPGPLYRIAQTDIVPAEGARLPPGLPSAQTLGLAPGTPARARTVIQAQEQLVGTLAQRGYAFARVVDRRTVVDHDARTTEVTFTVEPGPRVRFGMTEVRGLERVDAAAVLRRLPWQRGDVYEPALLEQARANLADLGVFSAVRVRLAEAPGPEGVTPVVVTVEERARRFIGFGGAYSTAEGLSANANWGHRNLFGGAERLRLTFEIARVGENTVEETDLAFTANFQKPDFLWRDQSLILEAAAVSEQPEAFERDALILSGRLSYQASEALTLEYGLTFEEARISERGVERDAEGTLVSRLVGLPLAATYDRTDSVLNPTSGWRSLFATTPYQQTGGETASFVVSRWTNSLYLDLTGAGRYIAAGRLSLGSILGPETRDIPADKRFYAGGGGSIRGYGFQEVGPRDAVGDPIGGRSLVELGLELRLQVTESIGIVPFLDGGNVYDDSYPTFEGDLRWGAGIGLRYFTAVGPVRVDVAFPLNPRGDDDSWQFYLSFGQAF